MLKNGGNQDNLFRYLALCGIAVPIVFATLVTVAGYFYQDYSHVTQAVSELGGVEAQYHLLQNANFVVLGLLLLAFAFGLYRGLGARNLGPVFIGFFGVVSVLHSVLPCDPGCDFQTLTGTLHNVTGLAGFLAAIAGIFLVSRNLNTDPQWRSLSRFSWMAGVVVLVSLVLWIGVAKTAEIGSLNGVLQRVFILAWFVWVEVMAIRLFQISKGQSFVSQARSLIKAGAIVN